MLKKLWAFGLFVLALSPFTAPFQTWYPADVRRPLDSAILSAADSIPTLPDKNDPGSLIAPRSTKPGVRP
jgi:hypothetical protein